MAVSVGKKVRSNIPDNVHGDTRSSTSAAPGVSQCSVLLVATV